MDPLTHTLVGAALARTRVARSTSLAGAACLVGANLPDIDVLSYFAGSDAALGFRRGFTHGALVLPVLPLALTAALLAWDAWRRRGGGGTTRARPGPLLLVSTLAVLTHPALDWLNTYGIRLLAPFTERWFYGDTLFIIDPWVWLILGGTLFLARPSDRFRAGWLALATAATAIVFLAGALVPATAKVLWSCGLAGVVALDRARRPRARPSRLPAIGLATAAVYVLAMTVLAWAAAGLVRDELERLDVRPVHDLMVGPTPANPLRWDVLAETPFVYRHGSFHWLPAPRLRLEAEAIPRPGNDPVVEAAMAAPEVRGAMLWMRFPFVEIEPAGDGGYTVYLLDARYVRERTRGFGAAVVELDRELRPRRRAPEAAVTRRARGADRVGTGRVYHGNRNAGS